MAVKISRDSLQVGVKFDILFPDSNRSEPKRVFEIDQ